jgi:ribosome biogenesis protein NSA2
MPQNEYIEKAVKNYGRRLDTEERARKREARLVHERAHQARRVKGIRAKILSKKRYQEKAEMKKKVKEHEEKASNKHQKKAKFQEPVPVQFMDRDAADPGKVLTNSIKQKRKTKAAKWSVPIPVVAPMKEDEMFKVSKTGRNNQWKRVIPKVCYVGESFTRKPPKYERFIRPMGLRFKKANVTHPELKKTFTLPIVGVKHNAQSRVYTTLGVITKGTIIEVNVSEMGLVTPGGKVIWAKYAQVTNSPENDGCINSVLLV